MTHTHTILLVDDDHAYREVAQEILEMEGYTVVAAENGAVAWSFIQQSTPDLILSDSLMPEMSGIELLQVVKADMYLKSIPFVLVAGNNTDSFISGARTLGAEAILLKPVAAEEMFAVIDKILNCSASIG